MEEYSKIVLLAVESGILDCLQDPYDEKGNGDYYSSIPRDLERFATLILLEVENTCLELNGQRLGEIDFMMVLKERLGRK